MRETIDRLLTTYSDADPETRHDQVRHAVTEVARDVNLPDLRAAIVEQFEQQQNGGDLLDADTVGRLEALADVAETVATCETEQVELAQRARAATARATQSQPQQPAAAADDGDDTDEPGDDSPHHTPAGSPPPEKREPAGGDGGAADDDAAPADNQSSAAPQRRVPLSQMPQTNLPAFTRAPSRTSYTFRAAADIPGVPIGAELDGITQLGEAVRLRMGSLARVSGQRSSGAVATIHRTAPPEVTYRSDGDWQLVDEACNERKLPGGNLIAAAGQQGGWCAPSEILYDMCPTAVVEGVVDLPEITTPRGGIKYPVVPSFSEVYQGQLDDGTALDPNARGFHLTEGQIAGDPPAVKPCYRMPCPTMDECRLDVAGLCITTDLLTERAWPEAVQYFTQQVLAAHAHAVNAWVLAKMQSLAATTITLPSEQVTPEPNGSVEDPHGPGSTPRLLSMLELQVEHIRARHRLGMDTTLEMVAPSWLRGLIRSDLSKRLGVDSLTVSDATINAHFAARGVRVQWVLDWQDSFALHNAGTEDNPNWQPIPPDNPNYVGIGGPTPPMRWPSPVRIMIYPAGTVFRSSADVITLDAIYSVSGNNQGSLTRNQYTSLFTEEGVQVCVRCYDITVLEIPMCPSGISGGMQITQCTTVTSPQAATAGDGASADEPTPEPTSAGKRR